jgi:hypothetical protein
MAICFAFSTTLPGNYQIADHKAAQGGHRAPTPNRQSHRTENVKGGGCVYVTVVFLLVCSNPSSPSAAVILQSSISKPCVDGTIVLAPQGDAPARLSVQEAICEDFSSNVDLLLEKTSAPNR